MENKLRFLRILFGGIFTFYAGFFCVAYVLGHIDYAYAKGYEMNERQRPLLCIPGPVTYMDGGTATWTGLGYTLTRRHELKQPANEAGIMNILAGWELRPWGVFELPIIGNSLFKKESLTLYANLFAGLDVSTAETLEPVEGFAYDRAVEDIKWLFSLIGFIVGFLLFRLIRVFLLRRKERRGSYSEGETVP